MSVNTVLRGDCRQVLPQLPAASVDLVLTDPPYLVNYRARDGRTVAGDVDDEWLLPSFREVYRVLKANRFCVSFYGWNRADDFLSAWRAAGFRPVGHLVWVKPYASRRGFLASHHESAYLLAKGAPLKPAAPIPDVLDWEYTGNHLHPTQKPVSGLAPLISRFSRPGDLVLDPFAGSGSTLVAAQGLGRRYLGIELDEGYQRAALARLAESREAYAHDGNAGVARREEARRRYAH